MRSDWNFKNTITKDEIDLLPRSKFSGQIYYIDTLEAFDHFFPLLQGHEILGFDTETKPTFTKGAINEVSLLQLSTTDQAFLFRLNRIGLPLKLSRILADKNIIKAGVAIRDDIAVLRKLQNFHPASFIDLQQYVKDFGIDDNGLKKLAANILGFQISKRQQTSNWELDLLTPAQIEYAATDAWVCLEIYTVLTELKRNNGEEKN